MINLYDYQKDAVRALLGDKHILIAGTGLGKGFISLEWARQTGKKNVVVITQASKVKSNDFINEAQMLDDKWYSSLSSFTVSSWNGLTKWFNTHSNNNFNDYAFIFDECQRSKAGVSSSMGRSFLKITYRTSCWTGYTATPGDKWIDLYGYFVATNKVRNKTSFMSRFCNIQTYKGYPEIVNYREVDTLQKWWNDITYFPDTKNVEEELPEETHKVVEFKAPSDYKKVIKTRKRLDNDEFIDTSMGMCHYLRQLCATADKLEWIADFVESIGTNCVIFYNYIEEGEQIKKALKNVKVWEINGQCHDIPTAETIGKTDVVLAQWTSGSASLNLQFMNYWVAFTPCYSLTTSVQARGRIKRIGQKKPMFYYYLKTNNSIEVDIYKALAEKKDFSETTWYKNNFEEGE